jgi:hypothetical protein
MGAKAFSFTHRTKVFADGTVGRCLDGNRSGQVQRIPKDAQNALTGALGRLLVTVERYPDLKSNQNFLALQSQLVGTENRIATTSIACGPTTRNSRHFRA